MKTPPPERVVKITLTMDGFTLTIHADTVDDAVDAVAAAKCLSSEELREGAYGVSRGYSWTATNTEDDFQ